MGNLVTTRAAFQFERNGNIDSFTRNVSKVSFRVSPSLEMFKQNELLRKCV